MDERIKRLRQAIEKSGLTYAELGKITGIAKSSLQRYATGATKKIPIDNIEAIAQATGVSAKYLLCWDDDMIETHNFLKTLIDPEHTSHQVIEENEAIDRILEKSDNSQYIIQKHYDPASSENYIRKTFIDEGTDTKFLKLKKSYDLLNDTGKDKAIERIEELTMIPAYQKSADE